MAPSPSRFSLLFPVHAPRQKFPKGRSVTTTKKKSRVPLIYTSPFKGSKNEISANMVSNRLGKVQKHVAKKKGKNVATLHENSRDTKRLQSAAMRDNKLNRIVALREKQNKSYSTSTKNQLHSGISDSENGEIFPRPSSPCFLPGWLSNFCPAL